MDSNSKPRVSLSAEQAGQPKSRTLSSLSSSGSFPIRAPLTIDDDDDDDNSFASEPDTDRVAVAVSDGGYGSSSSGSSNASEEGFGSGEEFESASERPSVPIPDEEIVEESGGFVYKYESFRPFVDAPGGEFSEISVVGDEARSLGDEYDGPVVDLGLAEHVNVKPIAQLSLDDDGSEFDELSGGEETMGSEVEDGAFSSVVKGPSFRRVDSAPRIKVMDVEGGEEESLSEPLSPEKFDGLVSSKFLGVENAELGTSAEEILISNGESDKVAYELVEDKGNNSTLEAQSESFVDRKQDVFKFGNNFVEQGPALQNYAQEKIELNDQNGHKTKEDNAEIAIVPVLNHLKELKVEEAGGGAEEPSECKDNRCSRSDDSRSLSLDRNGDPDHLEVSTEPETDLGVHLCDPLAIISGESIYGAMNIKKIHSVDSSFSEPNPSSESAELHATIEGDGLEDVAPSISRSFKFVNSSFLDLKAESEAENEPLRIGRRQKGLLSDENVDELISGSSRPTKKVIHGLEERLASASLVAPENFEDDLQGIDGQFVMDLDDKLHSLWGGAGNEILDFAAVVALWKSANSATSGGGDVTITSANDSHVSALQRPDVSGFIFPSSGSILPPNVDGDVSKANLSQEEKSRIEKIQLLRVKLLRLVLRLGYSYDDFMVVRVLESFAQASGELHSQAFSIVAAKRTAAQHEEESKNDLDFSLNILVLGKSGVGKSATINSIFCVEKGSVDAFEPATTSVKVIVGTIYGVTIRILDTPGLRYPVAGQNVNGKILASIKRSMKRFPPDVVLYVDRLDIHTGDYNDLPLLRSLTNSLGSSIWKNAIVCLTHAASDPPDGPSGLPQSYKLFVAQRARVIQQSISLAVDDLLLMNPSMMHPVSLVENHQSCQKTQTGESVLPNGQIWRPRLLLSCFSLKILSEAKSMSKSQDPFINKKFSAFRCSAPLSYFLSSLLQSRTHSKLSADQGEDDDDSNVDLGNSSDSEQDDDGYDQLPPFKPLTKSQVAKLSKELRKAHFKDYDYRVKLLQKKQWKEQVKRLREIKKKGSQNNIDYQREDEDPEDRSPATVPDMLPDFVLPPSFDGDNPAYRYRLLEPTPQLLVRPVLDPHSWDHDCGYDGVILERNFTLAGQFPGAFAVQITKDKKELKIYLDSSISVKRGQNGLTLAGLDIQTVGRQLAYALRGKTKFRNFKINKTCAGLSVTLLGENVATGLKLEDQIVVGKRLVLAGDVGAVQSCSDTAYEASLEFRLKDEDFPIGQDNSSLGLSMVSWRGNVNLVANLQSQFTMGRSTKMAVRFGLNNKRSGQITVKLNSSEQLQMALIGILPVALFIFRSICAASGGTNGAY